MNPSMRVLALSAFVLAGAPAAHATDVGVSVQISQPGVYGRVDIGNVPQPQVIYQQPVLVQPPVVVVGRPAPPPPQPVYMWVPPGHQKHWSRYCRQYNACGVPVYFVRDDWYNEHVYRDHDHGRGHDRDDRDDRDDDHGHGHGRGRH